MNNKQPKLQNGIKRVLTPSTIDSTNSDSLNSSTIHSLSKLQKSQNISAKNEMVKQFDEQLKKSNVYYKYCEYSGKLNALKKHMKRFHPKEFCEMFDKFRTCPCCKQAFKKKNLDSHIDKCMDKMEFKTKRQMKQMVQIKMSFRIAKEDEYSEQEYQQDIDILRNLFASEIQKVDFTSAILQQMEVKAVSSTIKQQFNSKPRSHKLHQSS